jgi:Amt family ammonium transporter
MTTQAAWVLMAGFLVMFMHLGFALAETGLCRAKNAAHTMSMNLMVYALASLAFWGYGFALGWGNAAVGPAGAAPYAALGKGTTALDTGLGLGTATDSVTTQGDSPIFGRMLRVSARKSGQSPTAGRPGGGWRYGLLGLKGFFLSGIDSSSVLTLFFFMAVVMSVSATVPTGTLAERWAWRNFCLFGLWFVLPYGLYANWVWGGGWLAEMGVNWHLGHGAVDFAGSGVVHAFGGVVACAGAIVLGPRLGKYQRGRPQPLPGHHVAMTVAGTLVLAAGWFGLNAGFALLAADGEVSLVVVNTLLASVAGAVAAMLTLYAKRMKPDPTMMCNGLLAGLVAVSASCGLVDSRLAALIGAVAGVLVVLSVMFWEKRGIDDPVGAISIHGVGGLWGLLALGLLADGRHAAGCNGVAGPVRGLLFGDPGQLAAQLIAAAVVLVFGFAAAYAAFKLSSLAAPLRVGRDNELEGLDGPEMGALGYPDFTVSNRY